MPTASLTMPAFLLAFLPWAAVAPRWAAAKSWLAAHAGLVSVVGGLSMILSLAGLMLVPFVIARLPADFFLRLTLPPAPVLHRPHPARVIGRNLLGMLLVVLGALLVPLPGPGALVALLGLALVDFPGKRRFLAWVLRGPAVWRSINWLRRRAGRQEMLAPGRPVARGEAGGGPGPNVASA